VVVVAMKVAAAAAVLKVKQFLPLTLLLPPPISLLLYRSVRGST